MKHLIIGLLLFLLTLVLPFWVIMPTLIIWLNRQLGLPLIIFPGSFPLGFLLFAAGTLLSLYTLIVFSLKGQGTPAPVKPPTKFIASGLYSYTRNPMYLGYILVFLGEFFLFGSSLLLIYALAAFIFFHLFLVYYEEPKLVDRFGKSYREYLKSVPRWLNIFKG